MEATARRTAVAAGGRTIRAGAPSRSLHGSLWTRGMLMAEAEIGSAGPPGGRWAREAVPGFRAAPGDREVPEAGVLEEAGARSLAA